MTFQNRSLALLASVVSIAGCTVEPDLDAAPEPEAVSELSSASDVWTGPRAVYVMDNEPARNAIVRFRRGLDGSLTRTGTFPTGGLGTGAGLGSQGAVVLSADGRRLFVVNAGSDEISWFDVYANVLVLRDIASSGGANPISLALHGDLLYVVNAGRDSTASNIAGFRVGERLLPISGSVQPLSSAAPAPAQIEFSPSGRALVVTEKATNNLTTYLVDAAGRASAPTITASHGQTPFGFSFDRYGTLIVSEAFGGGANASALSSYRLTPQGVPVLISGSVPTGQTAACWVALGGADRFAYTTNTGSDSVSGYAITPAGALVRFGDGGLTASTGDAPTDLDFTADRRFLYVLDAAADAIEILRARHDGTLERLGQLAGLPAAAVGLAAQ